MMRRKLSRYVIARFSIGAILAGAALASGTLAHPAGPDYTRHTARPFAVVVAAVDKAAQANGFRVSGHHNVAASLRQAGVDRGAYTVVEVCNAKIAARVLAAEPRLGALMPCRIAVYEQGGQTVLTTILPSRLAALFHNPAALSAARPVDGDLRRIIDDAVKP